MNSTPSDNNENYEPAPKPKPPTADVASCFSKYQQLLGPLRENLKYRPPNRGHRTDSALLEAALAGRQPAGVELVDWVDTDYYKAAVVEAGNQPGEAHYTRVDMVLAGGYYTALARTSSENHEEGDRTEVQRVRGSSPHSLRGRGPAFR